MGAPRRYPLTAGTRGIVNRNLRFTSDEEHRRFSLAFRKFILARGLNFRRYRGKHPKHDEPCPLKTVPEIEPFLEPLPVTTPASKPASPLPPFQENTPKE